MYSFFGFILIVATLFALWRVFRPLQGQHRYADKGRNDYNLAIYRQRLDELVTQYQQQIISDELYQQMRHDLDQALLRDIPERTAESGMPVSQAQISRVLPWLVCIVIVLLAGTLYGWQGNWKAIDPEMRKLPSPEVLVLRLQERLAEEPGSVDDWVLLGQSYVALKRYADGRDAYREAYRLAPDNVQILLSYIEAMGRANNGSLQAAEPLLEKARQLAPDSPDVSWFYSILLMQKGQWQPAMAIWVRLLDSLENPDQRQMLEMLIANARQKLGAPEANPHARVTLQVEVALDPALAGLADANDVVFIFARAASGPPMPLAVVRKWVRDLPVTVTLSDKDAMMANMTLSKFPEVLVGARISKKGSAMPVSGDLQILSPPFAHARQTTPLKLNISEIVP